MNRAWVLGTVVSLAPGLCHAQAAYRGDCARARQYAADNPVESRFNSGYKGVSMWHVATQDCGDKDVVRAYAINPKSATDGAVEFDLKWRELEIWAGKNAEGCLLPKHLNSGGGSARIWQTVTSDAGVCQVTISIQFKIKSGERADWSHEWTQDIVPQGPTRFVTGSTTGSQRNVTAFYRVNWAGW